MTNKTPLAMLVTALMAACGAGANAQILSEVEGFPPYKLGATVALNVPNFSGSPYQSSLGFNAGLNLMVDGSDYVMPNTFARVSLLYSMKGAYHEYSKAPDDYMKDWYTTHYIELPVHAGYAWYVNEDWSVMAEAGPYLAVGLFGNRKTERMIPGMHLPTSSDEDFFSAPINCTRFDMGFGLQLSAMYLRDYQFHIAYDFGFVNMHSSFQQNRNLSMGFTYFFE